MDKIETAEQLEQLQNRISEVRLKVKHKAEKTYFFDLLGNKERADLARGVAWNERCYAQLPKEIKLSHDIGQQLSFALAEFDKKQKSITPDEALFSFLKTSTSILATVAFPSPHTGLNLVHSAADTFHRMKNHLNEREGLKKLAADSVLGSYKLVKKDSGEYTLQLGRWSIFALDWAGPRGSTSTEFVLGVEAASLTDLVFPPSFCSPRSAENNRIR